MRHIEVTECRIADGRMSEFVNGVQQWERAAMSHDAAPSHQAVLIDPEDPARVLIITQFADGPTAERFAASGLLERFMQGVMQCSAGSATHRRYELFYAAGEGPRAIFGEIPKENV